MDIAKPSQSKVKRNWYQFESSKKCVPHNISPNQVSWEKLYSTNYILHVSSAVARTARRPRWRRFENSPQKYSFICKCHFMNEIINKVFRVRTTSVGDDCHWRAWTCYNSKVSQNPSLFTSLSFSASAWLLSLPGTSSVNHEDQTLLSFFQVVNFMAVVERISPCATIL